MNAYANHVVSYLLAQSWQIALLAAIVGLISLALRNRSAHLRYLLWLIVLAKCLVPPFLTVPLAVLPERSARPSVALADLPEEQSAPGVPVFVGADLKPPESAPTLPSTGELIALAWTAGVCLFLLWVGGRAARYTSWLRDRRKPLPPDLQESIRELSVGFKFRKWPRIWLLEDISQPFVWGVLRGSVYLPADFAGLRGSDQQRNILAHELSHIARFDAGVNLLQVLAQTVYWFHPFVWWSNRKIRQEREKCCDEMAIVHLNTPPEHYTGAIVDVLAAERRSPHRIPSLAIVGSVKDIEERIKTMLRPGRTFRKHPSLIGATVALLVALVTIPTALVLTARGQGPTAIQTTESQKPAPSRYPARTFNSGIAFHVFVREAEDTALTWIGRTPSVPPLRIPACLLWEVKPAGPAGDWNLLVNEMKQSRVPGLGLQQATDADLKQLAGLGGLESLEFLDLAGAQITDDSLANLKGLTGLWGLSLYGAKITGPGLEHLKGLAGLRWLDLGRTAITDAGLQHLKGLKGLRLLSLWNTQITNAGLEHLKGLSDLENLGLQDTAIGDAGLDHLRDLKMLTSLWLRGTRTTVAGVERLTGLTELDLSNTSVTDADLANLTRLARLQELVLLNTEVTNAGLEHLKALAGLRRLYLGHTQITDAGLEHLKGLTGLQKLGLSNTKITDMGLEHLKGRSGLQKLFLANTQITDAGLTHLEGLSGLQWLDLPDTQVTDAGLAHLKSLTELRHLNLNGTRITDVGLANLKAMRRLEFLTLTGTQVTDAGVQQLKQNLPTTAIWTDQAR